MDDQGQAFHAFVTVPPNSASNFMLLIRRHIGMLLSAGILGLAAYAPSDANAQAISLDAARAEHEAGRAIMIDIRETHEHATGVARGARLLPMSQLGARLSEIPTDPSMPVLLICNTQNRSSAALKALRERGYRNLQFVQGGMSEWRRRGWPMVKPGP